MNWFDKMQFFDLLKTAYKSHSMIKNAAQEQSNDVGSTTYD